MTVSSRSVKDRLGVCLGLREDRFVDSGFRITRPSSGSWELLYVSVFPKKSPVCREQGCKHDIRADN